MWKRSLGLAVCALAAVVFLGSWAIAEDPSDKEAAKPEATTSVEKTDEQAAESHPIRPGEMADFVKKGVAWLIAAQHNDGGWGGGSHADQQNRDAHKVQTDPGTTAFTLLSLLRAGHTPVAGEYQAQVRKGLEYLVTVVEKAPADGPRITDVTGTQPQSKLGQYVDTPLTAQYLARAFAMLKKDDPLRKRVDAALDKCLAKLQASQQKDGGWGEGGGWAPVLQSSLSCSALEVAQASGKEVDGDKLASARQYQKSQVEVKADGGMAVRTEGAAGVQLYAFGGAIRGNAAEAREAELAVKDGIASGKLAANAPVTEDNLKIAGVSGDRAQRLSRAAGQNTRQLDRLDDEKMLEGFGSNGGEEFLSYLLTSESLVIAGAEKFQPWNDKMHGRLQKIQNTDGSWTGHHCITSPVFCTAAVVQCLTTDRDAEFLIAMADKTKTGAKDDDIAKK